MQSLAEGKKISVINISPMIAGDCGKSNDGGGVGGERMALFKLATCRDPSPLTLKMQQLLTQSLPS